MTGGPDELCSDECGIDVLFSKTVEHKNRHVNVVRKLIRENIVVGAKIMPCARVYPRRNWTDPLCQVQRGIEKGVNVAVIPVRRLLRTGSSRAGNEDGAGRSDSGKPGREDVLKCGSALRNRWLRSGFQACSYDSYSIGDADPIAPLVFSHFHSSSGGLEKITCCFPVIRQ